MLLRSFLLRDAFGLAYFLPNRGKRRSTYGHPSGNCNRWQRGRCCRNCEHVYGAMRFCGGPRKLLNSKWEYSGVERRALRERIFRPDPRTESMPDPSQVTVGSKRTISRYRPIQLPVDRRKRRPHAARGEAKGSEMGIRPATIRDANAAKGREDAAAPRRRVVRSAVFPRLCCSCFGLRCCTRRQE